MNLTKLILAGVFAIVTSTTSHAAPKCCEKAKAEKRECDHPCCVTAKAAKKDCDKCKRPTVAEKK